MSDDFKEKKLGVKKTIRARLKSLFEENEQPLNSVLVLGTALGLLVLLALLAKQYGALQGAYTHPLTDSKALSSVDLAPGFQCHQQDLSCGAPFEEGL